VGARPRLGHKQAKRGGSENRPPALALAWITAETTTMTDPIKPAPPPLPDDAKDQAAPGDKDAIPASPTDGRLGPAADPAEGKRD
jgi:hypothetical protein